jgi:hypothetical protein
MMPGGAAAACWVGGGKERLHFNIFVLTMYRRTKRVSAGTTAKIVKKMLRREGGLDCWMADGGDGLGLHSFDRC